MEDCLPDDGEEQKGADQLLHLWQEEEAAKRKAWKLYLES
jgi:hypothetical protein